MNQCFGSGWIRVFAYLNPDFQNPNPDLSINKLRIRLYNVVQVYPAPAGVQVWRADAVPGLLSAGRAQGEKIRPPGEWRMLTEPDCGSGSGHNKICVFPHLNLDRVAEMGLFEFNDAKEKSPRPIKKTTKFKTNIYDLAWHDLTTGAYTVLISNKKNRTTLLSTQWHLWWMVM